MNNEYEKEESLNNKLLSVNSLANRSSKRHILLDNSSKLSFSKIDDSNNLFLNSPNLFASLNKPQHNSVINNKLTLNQFPILQKSQELEKQGNHISPRKNQTETTLNRLCGARRAATRDRPRYAGREIAHGQHTERLLPHGKQRRILQLRYGHPITHRPFVIRKILGRERLGQ